MNIGTPSTGKIIAFALSVLVIGLGVAFAPDIRRAISKYSGGKV